MTTLQTTKKTFSLPAFIVDHLDMVSNRTGYSQSNIVLQALASYLHRYEDEGSVEHWLALTGLTSGMMDESV